MSIKKRKLKDIGEMTEQIDILHKTMVKTETGHEPSYSVVGALENIWAAVKDTTGVRVNAKGFYENRVLRTFEIRYHDNFDTFVGSPSYYVRHRDRRYKIVNIENPSLANRYLILTCEAMDLRVA